MQKIQKIGLIYAMPAIALSALAITYYIYLPKFYLEKLAVSPLYFGLIVIMTRTLDAFIDPYIGRWIDANSAWRKKILVIAMFPLVLASFGLVNVDSSDYELPIFLAFSIVFYLAWSAYSVPYQTIGLNLSDQTKERTFVLGLREASLLLGTILASVLPFLLLNWDLSLHELTDSLSIIIAIYAVILFLTSGLVYRFLPQRSFVKSELTTSERVSFHSLWLRSDFRYLLITYGLTSFGSTLSGALILFFIGDVLKSSQGNLFVLIYFLSALIFIPCWFPISNQIGRIASWLLGLLIALGSFLCVCFLTAGDEYLYLALIVVSSFGLGAAIIMPAALQADVAERASVDIGRNVDSLIVGYYSLTKKLAAAVAAGVAFPILDFFAYDPGGVNDLFTLNILTVMYVAIPAFLYAVTIFFVLKLRNV